MGKRLTIHEEIFCDVCGDEIFNGNSNTRRIGNLYLGQNGTHVQYGVSFNLSVDYGKTVENICNSCLRDFLDQFSKNLG
jgi:hypothetical protein